MQSKNSIETPSLRFLQDEPPSSDNDAPSSKNQRGMDIQSDASIQENNFQQGLRIKFQRLKLFISELGQIRDTPINSDLLQQLQIDQQVHKNVCYETVIIEAEKRIEKMTKTRKYKRNWSVCDLKILIWLIYKHCERDSIPLADIHNILESWKIISSLIPGTSSGSCLFKWLSLKRHKITLYSWSEEEEQILIKLEQKYADSRNKWKYISEQLYSRNPKNQKIYRHPKQCRQHYASFLDPQIKKGPWTKDEDLGLLAHIVENNCQKKWCKLVKILQGRTQNAIKNRFQLIFAKMKKKKQNKSKGEMELITDYIKEHGGIIPPIKKQRDPAVKNQSPPLSFHSFSPEESKLKVEEPIVSMPIIPSFSFGSNRSLSSAFTPYLQAPLYQQLPDHVYYQLTAPRKTDSLDGKLQVKKEEPQI